MLGKFNKNKYEGISPEMGPNWSIIKGLLNSMIEIWKSYISTFYEENFRAFTLCF